MSIKELHEKIAKLESALVLQSERADQAEQAYNYLQYQYEQLLRHRFGVKSEKYIDPNQGSLFDTELTPANPDEAANDTDDNVINIEAHKRRKNRSKKAPTKRIITIPVEDKQCHCGCQKAVIRYETCEYYHFQPAVFELIEERREVVVCPKGCQQSIETAKKPPHVLPKTSASHALLAYIMVSKFVDRQPLYHLEKQFASRYGIQISRGQMAHWLIRLKPQIQPLLNLLKDQIIDYDIASLDATGLQVLKEPGRPATKASYAYCFRGGPPDKKVVLYEYNAENHKPYLVNWFLGFKGTIHADADPFFDDLVKDKSGILLSYCNAHGRRKFEPIAKAVKTDAIAHHAMRVYRQLYRVEREAKNDKLDATARYKLRQKKSKPILDEFKQWLEGIYPTLLPKSPLAKAVHYVLKHWAGLTLFLTDGRLEIDNSATEQEIKAFVILRKNFLFADTVDGAQALCAHISLLRTAIVNGLDPYKYIKAVLDALPHCKTVEDYEALLPWNIELEPMVTQQAA